jgi:hypothetical protein
MSEKKIVVPESVIDFPVCLECGETIWAGQPVRKQNNIHALCTDPDMKNHERLFAVRDGESIIGYVNDTGEKVWL